MVAEHYNVSREKQDEYALISHTRANKVRSYYDHRHLAHRPLQSVESGIFADEIIPIEIKGKTFTKDDTIRPGVTAESLAGLKPAFPQWGPSTTTAGNASGIGDGAGLCIMTTRENAEREGMSILGKWVSTAVVGVQPRYMGISPVAAIPAVLERVGLSKEDVDIYEVCRICADE